MADEVTLTPEEETEYWQAAGRTKPAAKFNPFAELDAADLAELSIKDKEHFDVAGEFYRNKELWKDQSIVQKAADAVDILRQRGFEFSDIPGPGKIVHAAKDIAVGLGKNAWNLVTGAIQTPFSFVAELGDKLAGVAPEESIARGSRLEGQRKIAESWSGTEAAITGLQQQAVRGVKKVADIAAHDIFLGTERKPATPEEKVKNLWGRIGEMQTVEAATAGKGPFVQGALGTAVEQLDAAGKSVRPERVAELSMGDPFTFYAFGKAVHALGKLEPAAGITGVSEKLGGKLTEAVGGLTGGAGNLVELGGKAATLLGKPVNLATKIVQAVAPPGLLPPVVRAAGRGATKVGPVIEKAGQKISDVGAQIAGFGPLVLPVAQLGKDVIQTIPGVAVDVTRGLGMDIGLAAVTSESPQETEGTIGIGAAFGALAGLKRAGGRIVSGQLMAPRAWGAKQEIASSGQHPGFDAMHKEFYDAAPPAVKERINALRQFLQGAAPGVDLFAAKDKVAMKKSLLDAGLSDATSGLYADQLGFFTADIPGRDGTSRRVVGVIDVDAAPHESFHAFQDVLGESANRALDEVVKQDFAHRWEYEGQRYADRLKNPEPQNWREFILDKTGWGLAAALEKLSLTKANEISAVTGGFADPAAVKDLISGAWNEALRATQKQTPGMNPEEVQQQAWRGVLDANETVEVSDRYIAREIAAENFDAVFKNLGPKLEEQKKLIPRLARVVGSILRLAGGEPMGSRQSEIGKLPIRSDTVEAIKSQVRGELPAKVTPLPKTGLGPRPSVGGGIPATPEQQVAAAEQARAIASEAPETIPTGGTRTTRELLGDIAEAIASRVGIKINYSSAPGEPAAAITANRAARRAVIEFFRSASAELRALWEKNFFPERIIRLGSGKLQVLGWAPEVFAANAHRMAGRLTDAQSPYPLDPVTKSYTPEGWKQLYEDTAKVVENQMGGRTGAGDPLVVPASVTAKDYFAPPVIGEAAGLDQRKADFINMLFGTQIPKTSRITKGKMPLNIAGQEVSAATKPGRVGPTVEPRVPFGESFEGREIQEVNPLRAELERAGVDVSGLIEAQQRLNVDSIKEVQAAPEIPQFRGNTLTLAAGFQPREKSERKGFVGILRKEDNSIIAKYGLLGEIKHSQLSTDPGVSFKKSWRYSPDTKIVHWWFGHPNEIQREAVANYLQKKGFEVTRHADIVDEESFNKAHGQFNPSEAEDRQPLALRPGGGQRRITITGPDGTLYNARFDGYQEIPGEPTSYEAQITPETRLPFQGEGATRSTTYKSSIEDAGMRIVEKLPTPEQWEASQQSEPLTDAAQFSPPKFTEEEVRGIPGAGVSYPGRTYLEASADAFAKKGNPWIRRSATPEIDAETSNADRTLLVQITSDLMNPSGNFNMDTSRAYYDKLYSGAREGYTRMDDFWEIPQWMGFASHIFPKADVYVVRDVAQAKQFLNEAGYKNIMFSALDVNKPFIRELAQSYKGKVDIGGWVDPKYFDGLPNVTWHENLESAAKANGAEFRDGVDYRHFEKSGAIPRLNMSTGCKYQCAFCTVEKKVVAMPGELITQQVEEIAKLGTELVYLGDKTFGQSPNYEQLADMNVLMRERNPNFKGFVVQTTASTMPKLSEEWLARSGIKFVELGIETYNDPILRAVQKPATEALMDKSTEALRKNGITLIPNIIIGLPGETAESYARTLKFLKDNADIISHANIYNLAVYPDAKLGKEITTASPDDFNENILEKSFHTNPEVHRQFAGDLYGLASELVGKTPATLKGQAQPAADLQPRPPDIREATKLWSAQFNPRELVTPADEQKLIMSKVRFTDGTLKPMFHSTVAEYPLEEMAVEGFKAHFGSPSAAAGRVLGPSGMRTEGANENDAPARTVPVFLNIENPIRLDDAVSWDDASMVAVELGRRLQNKLPKRFSLSKVAKRVDAIAKAELDDFSSDADEILAYETANEGEIFAMQRFLESAGYDGIVYHNAFERSPEIRGEKFESEIESDYGFDSYIPFHKDQIISPLDKAKVAQFSPRKKEDKPVVERRMDEEARKLLYARGTPPKDKRAGERAAIVPERSLATPADVQKFFREEPDYAILTATREAVGDAMAEENRKSNDRLFEELDKRGYKSVIPVAGTYKGVDQGENFLVLGIKPKEALALGQKYGQESVVVKQGLLHSADESVIPSRLENIVVGPEAEKLDFFSTLPNKVSFSIPFDFAAERATAQYMPKPKDDMKFARTQHNLPSKAWILPDGSIAQLGAQWHHHWLDENKEVQKRYGLEIPPFDGGDATGVRESALKKGFTRLNLTNGSLVAEARERDFRAIRPILEDLIEQNIGAIDRFRVTLLNDKVDKVTKSYDAQLFDLDTRKQKMAKVYETFSDDAQRELSGQFSPMPDNERAISSAAVQDANGRIFEGRYHGEALDKAMALGAKPIKGYSDPSWDVPFEVGFVTGEGEFLGREEAWQRAKEIGQVAKDAEPIDESEIHTRDFRDQTAFQPPRAEQEQLFGGRELLSTHELSNMSRKELREHFPEAIVPANLKEALPSKITESPLHKNSDDPVGAFADKLVEFAKQYEDDPLFQSGKRWYSEFTPMLKKYFGADAPLMAELLAATSPQTNPTVNFGYALDALEGLKSGRFKKIIAKFNQGMERLNDGSWEKSAATPARFMADWVEKYDLKPKQSNGKLYGQHSRPVLQVFARVWLAQNKGPKTRNFVENLLGTSDEATIDLWADRSMRRIGYEGTKTRWRIMPQNGTEVSDVDFRFSQKVFRAAAEQLRMKPSELQGALWFAEKSLWNERGWSRLDLGDYRREITKTGLLRQGVEHRTATRSAQEKTRPPEATELPLVEKRKLR